MKKKLTSLEVNNKKVLLRVDFNVPIKEEKITSDARILASLPTISYLLEQNAKVIICSHLGRPKGKVAPEFSLKPVAEHLQKLLNIEVLFATDTIGEDAKTKSENLKAGQVLLLENVRFNAGEETNDKEFSKALASLAEVYVNDAFATSHREEASMHSVAKLLPNAVGFLVTKELESISEVLKEPKRPFVAILGGAKVDGKLAVIDNLLDKVDVLLIGGGMSYTFIKALGGKTGKSLVDQKQIDYCYSVIKSAVNKGVKLLLPVDDVCNRAFDSEDAPKVFASGHTNEDYMALDIGPKTIKLFSKQIKKAKTVMWNGPLGVFENKFYETGTREVAKAVAKSRAFSVIGGGDTVSAIEKFGFEADIDHLSTGGGASLMLLEGKELPAIAVIEDEK
jgi:3-phosphoglycerate kinase